MTICEYCGEPRNMPCRSTRDMESEADSRKECFAALMFIGGGERSENQSKAALYRRLLPKLDNRPMWEQP